MKEIKIGEYVRTKKGKIAKVKTIYSEEDRIKMKNFSVKKETLINGNIKIPDVVNHSFEPIDLIERGDYVNGERIDYITTSNLRNGELILMTDGGYDLFKKYQSIKSIVTKEQFESMEYKVGG